MLKTIIPALLLSATCSLPVYAAEESPNQLNVTLPQNNYREALKVGQPLPKSSLLSQVDANPEANPYGYQVINEDVDENHGQTVRHSQQSLLQFLIQAPSLLNEASIVVPENEENNELSSIYEQREINGNAIDQYNLGTQYLSGWLGQTIKLEKAFEMLEKSALQGYAPAQLTLGSMYLDGKGIEQDNKEAYRWFKSAAAQGNSDAQVFTGVMLKQGLGTEKNVDAARIWLQLAAAQDNEDAKALLKEMESH